MKTLYSTILSLAVLAGLVGAGLTSCESDSTWGSVPPAGWNVFYDSSLTGCWELVQANSIDVNGYDVNYMYFKGNGNGVYYYYDHGYRSTDRFAYYCQRSGSGTSLYQINIQYQGRNPSTMSYWFTGDRLWMQWMTGSGTVTYVYRPIPNLPW